MFTMAPRKSTAALAVHAFIRIPIIFSNVSVGFPRYNDPVVKNTSVLVYFTTFFGPGFSEQVFYRVSTAVESWDCIYKQDGFWGVWSDGGCTCEFCLCACSPWFFARFVMPGIIPVLCAYAVENLPVPGIQGPY